MTPFVLQVLFWACLAFPYRANAFERVAGIVPIHDPQNPLLAKCADGLLAAVAYSMGSSQTEIDELSATLADLLGADEIEESGAQENAAALTAAGSNEQVTDGAERATRVSSLKAWMEKYSLIKPKTKETFVENHMEHYRRKKALLQSVPAEANAFEKDSGLSLERARALQNWRFLRNSSPGGEGELTLLVGSALRAAAHWTTRVVKTAAAAKATGDSSISKDDEHSSEAPRDLFVERAMSLFGASEATSSDSGIQNSSSLVWSGAQRALGTTPTLCKDLPMSILGGLLPEIYVDDLPSNILVFLSSKTMSDWISRFVGRSETEWVCPFYREPGRIQFIPIDGDLVSTACATLDYAYENDVDGLNKTCRLESLIESVLVCKDTDTDATAPDCSQAFPEELRVPLPETCTPSTGPYAGKVFDNTKDFFNLTYVDLLSEEGAVLPDYVDDATVQEEGLTHFFLFRSLNVFDAWRQFGHMCGIDDLEQDLVPGWNITFVFEAEEENEYTLSKAFNVSTTPLVFGMRPKHQLVESFDVSSEKCQVALGVRGTATNFEWAVDIFTRLQPILGDGIEAHMGFASMYSAAMGSVRRYIQGVIDECGCANVELSLVGHSMGGGVASIMALDMARLFDSCIKVHASLFGTPVVFNEAGAEEFGRRVNGRLFAHQFDPIPQAACPVQTSKVANWPICPESNTVVPMSDKEIIFQKTSYLPGRYVLNRTHFDKSDGTSLMPFPKSFLDISLDLKDLTNIQASVTIGLPGWLQMSAAHGCSYGCYFSTFCNGGAYTYMCSDECEISQETTISIGGDDGEDEDGGDDGEDEDKGGDGDGDGGETAN